jgi:hypothetical protein
MTVMKMQSSITATVDLALESCDATETISAYLHAHALSIEAESRRSDNGLPGGEISGSVH